MPLRRILPVLPLLCLLAPGLTSCVVKRRLIIRRGAPNGQSALKVADTKELQQKVSQEYNAIQNFTMTVDMTPALGTAEKNHITEYKDVRAYIVFRKPDDIRIIGLYPVVRNTAFDMVSTGDRFKLYVPSRNEFVEGSNTMAGEPSKTKIENLRPQHFLEALMVPPFSSNTKVFVENFTDEDNAYYIFHEVRENRAGGLDLLRTVWFNRLDLQIARQMIFDKAGNILTDARYSDWATFDHVPFPRHIEIDRPQDEYAVVLDIVKMDINQGVSDDKFVLNQPAGSKLRMVGLTSPAGAVAPETAKGTPAP